MSNGRGITKDKAILIAKEEIEECQVKQNMKFDRVHKKLDKTFWAIVVVGISLLANGNEGMKWLAERIIKSFFGG